MDNLNLLVNGGKINIKKKKTSNSRKTPLSKEYKTYLFLDSLCLSRKKRKLFGRRLIISS